MALTDHVGILLGHSLDVARLNKRKTRADFYAQVALPPEAVSDLAELVAAVYPGIPLKSLEVNINTNEAQAKPFVGVPNSWYIIRLASQFAPELYAADGVTAIPSANARASFYSGMHVRIHSSAWPWKNEFGKQGASFNLLGVMDAGVGGDRLMIGGGGAAGQAFKAHANPDAKPSVAAAAPTDAAVTEPAAPANPFVQASGAAKASGNPFA